MKQKKKYEEMQTEYDTYSSKYEAAVKEKMLMRLEKDRLIAKVENLEISLKQLQDEQDNEGSVDKGLSKYEKSSVAAGMSQKGGIATQSAAGA